MTTTVVNQQRTALPAVDAKTVLKTVKQQLTELEKEIDIARKKILYLTQLRKKIIIFFLFQFLSDSTQNVSEGDLLTKFSVDFAVHEEEVLELVFYFPQLFLECQKLGHVKDATDASALVLSIQHIQACPQCYAKIQINS
jgi:hypothetical protein